MRLKKFLRQFWSDPVASKVIGGLILVALTSGAAILTSVVPTIRLGLSRVLTTPVPLWVILVGFVIVTLAFGVVARIRHVQIKIRVLTDQSAFDRDNDGVVDSLRDPSDQQLWVSGDCQRGSNVARTGLVFDLSSVPSRSCISFATLRLRHVGGRGGSVTEVHGFMTDGAIAIKDVSDTWLLDRARQEGDYHVFNVTSFVQLRVNAGEQFSGFMLKGGTETSSSTYVSREHAVLPHDAPCLLVSYQRWSKSVPEGTKDTR